MKLPKLFLTATALLAALPLAAQSIPELRYSGFPPAGSAGRGGVTIDDLQQTALSRIDEQSAAEVEALAAARATYTDVAYALPVNTTAITNAVNQLANAELALALKRADGFAQLQASPQRLPDSMVQLVLQQYSNWAPPSPAEPAGRVAVESSGTGSAVLGELNRITGTIESDSYTVFDATILPDFKLELLYVAPTTMGSWVGMDFDEQGRLIVGSHNSAQAFRLTLPAIGSNEALQIESLGNNIGFGHSVLSAFDSLYFMVGDEQNATRRTSGLYRAFDTNGDDTFDTVRVLRNLRGWGQHGTHGGFVLAPDRQSIFTINGNATTTTSFTTSHLPYDWGEDTLVRRIGTDSPAAPEAWVAKIDPNGENWELWAIGMRNPVDLALNKDGELFTYDADMEFDKGAPFYRPTNIAHLISGADMHFRNDGGTRKRPAYDFDGWSPTIFLGSGSPTGITFGTGAKFPARYQDALFVTDWSYGNIYAVHLRPNGSTYSATAELFAAGRPFGASNVKVSPKDGALYVIVGGNSQSALYRVTYSGDAATTPTTPDTTAATARNQRRALEAYHGRRDPAAIAVVWPFLGSEDAGIRYAARIALEFQDPALWRDRALQETDPRRAMAALLALARVSGKDDYHRTAADPAPDKALQLRMIASLDRIDWYSLDYQEQLDLLRTYSLVFTRLGRPDAETTQRLIAKFDPQLPAQYRELNWELSEMLIYLEAPNAASKVMALLRESPSLSYLPRPSQYLNPLLLPRGTPGAAVGGNENVMLSKQEDQMQYAHLLRNLQVGWTPALREEFLNWFITANDQYSGGNSFKSYLGQIRADAINSIPEAARTPAIQAIIDLPYVVPAGGFGGGGGGGAAGRGGAGAAAGPGAGGRGGQ